MSTTECLVRQAIPRQFAAPQAPAAWALKQAQQVARPLSINRRVRPYRGPIFVSVFA
jgi:hypothetical protein